MREGLQNIEEFVRDRHFLKGLPFLIKQKGVLLRHFPIVSSEVITPTDPERPNYVDPEDPNLYHKVYQTQGVSVTTEVAEVQKVKGLVIGEDFIPTAGKTVFGIESTYLFTNDSLKSGDEVEITRPNGQVKRWKVTEPESVGLTVQVATRFKLESKVM